MIKKFCRKSWLTGFALGLAGNPLPFAQEQKKPVAYLYNGIQLPPLPEWDKAKYPYAFISNVKHATYQYNVYFSSSKWNSTGTTFKAATDVVSYQYYFCHVNASEVVWQYVRTSENSNSAIAAIADPLVWANFDVLNADGSVYLPASDPVPVYE